MSSEKKNSYANHFQRETGQTIYIVGKVNECRLRKKYELPVPSILQKKIANNRENLYSFFPKSTFLNLSNDINNNLPCFPLKWGANQFFFPGGHGGTPAKVPSNLKPQ